MVLATSVTAESCMHSKKWPQNGHSWARIYCSSSACCNVAGHSVVYVANNTIVACAVYGYGDYGGAVVECSIFQCMVNAGWLKPSPNLSGQALA